MSPTENDRSVVIRAPLPGEGDTLAQIRVAAWQQAYRGIVPDNYLDRLSGEDDAARAEASIAAPSGARWLSLAEVDGVICGFAVYSAPGTAEDDPAAELSMLYVAPSGQRKGLGGALLSHAQTILKDSFDTLEVWCLRDNWIGRDFYEKRGARLTGVTAYFELPGRPDVALRQVGYAWDLRAL